MTDEILSRLTADQEYVAVYFSGPCDDDDPDEECNVISRQLEDIDPKVNEYGIMLVTTEERELAKQHDVRAFPALGMQHTVL